MLNSIEINGDVLQEVRDTSARENNVAVTILLRWNHFLQQKGSWQVEARCCALCHQFLLLVPKSTIAEHLTVNSTASVWVEMKRCNESDLSLAL